MNAIEKMLTRIITQVWFEKGDKVQFSEFRKTINHSLATRFFESGKNIKQPVFIIKITGFVIRITLKNCLTEIGHMEKIHAQAT